ncbi:MAG: hypothetical protein P8K76_07115 [Candidatus Binatia bacterium]|nr:hypothetical protein [Candidatus Binatia bacterium]MDG1960489.1 hypothetical protein [Candidatus Binatia bacterium]MDG2009532.1 hypothetical protein [Candidatus Binatia bacterium]
MVILLWDTTWFELRFLVMTSVMGREHDFRHVYPSHTLGSEVNV